MTEMGGIVKDYFVTPPISLVLVGRIALLKILGEGI